MFRIVHYNYSITFPTAFYCFDESDTCVRSTLGGEPQVWIIFLSKIQSSISIYKDELEYDHY